SVVLVGCALFRARSFDDALTVVTGVAHLGRLDYGMLVTLGFPSYFEILLLGVHITLLFAIDFLIFARPHILAKLRAIRFVAIGAAGVDIFNAGRPARTDFVLLKRILARGTRPTHLLVQSLPFDEHEECFVCR